MRAYADTSFIVRLLADEASSREAMAEYNRLARPRLLFLPLHQLEVRNTILQRAFHQRQSLPASQRGQVAHDRDVALGRIEKYLDRRVFVETSVDPAIVFDRANELSVRYTEKLGARTIDILHVASALVLQAELFLSTDRTQIKLASYEGLKAVGI